MNNEKEEVPPRNDPRVLSIITDIQHFLNSGDQVVLPGFASFSVPLDARPEELKRKKLVETMDTYIPEPLRNADGTPIYAHATGSRAVRATDNSKPTDWRYKIGIFAHVDAGKTTSAERIRKLSGDIHKVGEIHDGESTTDLMSDLSLIHI